MGVRYSHFLLHLGRDQGHLHDTAIQVYRHHAARAISEERWSAAEVFFDRILEVNPSHSEAWLMKGHLRQHCKGDFEMARRCFTTVVDLYGERSRHPHAVRARQSLQSLHTLTAS